MRVRVRAFVRGGAGPLRFALALWAATAGCSPDPDLTTASLRLTSLESCRLGAVGALTLRASGDFPSKRRALDAETTERLDDLPDATRYLTIEARREGGPPAVGVLALPGFDLARPLLMLPLGRSCPVSDTSVAAASDAAVAALSDGGLLVAGGTDANGAAQSSALVLSAGERLATPVPDGMLLRRSGASATLVGTLVAVVGGAASDDSPAHEAFEIYDPALGEFDGGQSGKLITGRREHAAIALGSGELLVVGGRTSCAGPALDSAERVVLDGGSASEIDGGLARARIAPRLFALDSGAVVVVGGYRQGDPDDCGRGRGAVGEVELFDGARFREIGRFPEYDRAVSAAIEGERLAWVGCADERCQLTVARLDNGGFALGEPIGFEVDGGLDQMRLLALPDARVLLTGRTGGTPSVRKSLVIDTAAAAIEETDSSRVPEHSVALADGTLIALDVFGSSLSRLSDATPFDDAPTELLAQAALDDAAAWQHVDGGLRAIDDARLDLPFLRFADLRLELALDGAGTLLFEPDGAAPLGVAIDKRSAAIDACTIERDDEALVVTRRGGVVTLAAGERSQRCTVSELSEHVGLALRVEAGGLLRDLRVDRL